MSEKLSADGIIKIGANPDVDTSTVADIWEKGLVGGTLLYVFPTQARIHNLVSSQGADDGIATGTLTLVSAVAITAATGTVVCASVLAADTVTANGLLYTAVAGVKANNEQFSIDTSDTACALDLADSILNDVRAGTLNDLTAVSATDTVTMTQTVGGVGGNTTTLVSSNGTRLAVSGATFTGGLDADVATVNGLTFIGVAGVKANNTQFSIDTSDTAAAADLADSINNDTRPGVTVPTAPIVATSAAGVVTINSTGTIGNLVDIAGTSNITASGATLTDTGTGARIVKVTGVDANFAEITENVALNGATVAPTLKSYLRINDFEVIDAGSGGVNAGTITATAVTDATISAQIAIGKNKARQAIFSVPADRDLMLTSITIGVGKTTVTTIEGDLLVRPFGEVFKSEYTIPASTLGSNQTIKKFKPNLFIAAKSDIKLQTTVLVDASSVFGGFEGNFSHPANT